MKIKNITKRLLLQILILFSFISPLIMVPTAVEAANCNPDTEIEISVPVSEGGSKCIAKKSGADNPIYVYLRSIVRFISAGVGMVLLLTLIIGGIRFMTAQGNPQAVAAAVKLIISAVVGIILFALLFAILNYIIPGRLIER